MSRYSKNNPNGIPPWQFDPKSNVGLPRKLRCNVCSKVKIQEQFSNVTLRKVVQMQKENRRINFEHTAKVTCDFCNPGNRTELKCSECDKTKGLDEFSNGQRKQKDNARCRDCVMEQHNSKSLGQEYDDDSPEENLEIDDNEGSGVQSDGASTTDDGWVSQQGRGYRPSTTSRRTTTVAASSSRSTAGTSSAASNAAAPARTVAVQQSSPRTAGSSVTNTARPGTQSARAEGQYSLAKLDMPADDDSDPDSDVSSVDEY